MEVPTFEKLPEAVASIKKTQDAMLKLLKEMSLTPKVVESKYPENFGIDVLQDFIEEKTGKRPKKPTIYGRVYRREIPFNKPPGIKSLMFNRDEILNWLNNGRQVSHLKED